LIQLNVMQLWALAAGGPIAMVLTVLIGILVNNALAVAKIGRIEGVLKAEMQRVEGSLTSELKRIEGVLTGRIEVKATAEYYSDPEKYSHAGVNAVMNLFKRYYNGELTENGLAGQLKRVWDK